MNVFYEVMKKYPLMLSWNDKKYWTGFVSIQGVLVRLALKVPNFPFIHDCDMSGNTDTQTLCKPFSRQIEASMVGKDVTLLEFLDAFVNLIKTSDEVKKRSSLSLNSVDDQFYSTLMAELDQIGRENAAYTSADYREIHLKYVDVSGREHIARYHLTNRYPNVALTVNVQLPTEEKLAWPCKIVEANSFFASQVEKFQDFWCITDELDEKTRIIDPPKPNRTHTFRRILVQDRVILHIEINPLKPRKLPDITFTGPETDVSVFEALLLKHCNIWNDELSILQNLQNILEIEFLEKSPNELDAGDSVKCTVCYMYELDENSPERSCECGALYHNRCLYDLFLSERSKTLKKCVDCAICGNVSIISEYVYHHLSLSCLHIL